MKQKLSIFWFVVWSVSCVFLASITMAKHLIPLPASFQLSEAETSNTKSDRWHLGYVLAEGCGCSEVVADYLLTRELSEENTEFSVYYAGDPKGLEQKLKSQGFKFTKLESEEELEKFNIQSSPVFFVRDTSGETKYLGGFSPRLLKSIREVKDREIFERARLGKETEPYPVFGCAVGKKLKQLVDPVGLL